MLPFLPSTFPSLRASRNTDHPMDHEEGAVTLSRGGDGQAVRVPGESGPWADTARCGPASCHHEVHPRRLQSQVCRVNFSLPSSGGERFLKQKAQISKGKMDESTQSKMRELCDKALHKHSSEATRHGVFTARVTSEGAIPRLHGGLPHSCTTLKEEGAGRAGAGTPAEEVWRRALPRRALPRAPRSPGYTG